MPYLALIYSLRRNGLRLEGWALEKPQPNGLRTALLVGGFFGLLALAGFEFNEARLHWNDALAFLTTHYRDAAMHFDFSKIDVSKLISFHPDPKEAFKPVLDNHDQIVNAAQVQLDNKLTEVRNNGLFGSASLGGGILDLSFLRRKMRSRSLYLLGRTMAALGRR